MLHEEEESRDGDGRPELVLTTSHYYLISGSG